MGLTAEANKISPEEMHRIIGQRLNVNNVEQEYERECRSCGVDISNRPLNITQCLDCWRSGRGISRASLQGLSTLARRVNDSSTLNRDENEISKRIRSLEQNLKEIKEELELLKQKVEVDKLKEEDIERQLRMARKKEGIGK